MIFNKKRLLNAKPLFPMESKKRRAHGLSYGLSEAGYDVRIAQSVFLHPFRRFKMASTVERFDMPSYLVGIVHDKSTLARLGLSVFNTVVEPGWKGWLTLELVYHGVRPLYIKKGTGIAQVIFHEISDLSEYSGKYQDQERGPVRARLEY